MQLGLHPFWGELGYRLNPTSFQVFNSFYIFSHPQSDKICGLLQSRLLKNDPNAHVINGPQYCVQTVTV